MSFIREVCRDKEPEVPRNNVHNSSITKSDGMFPFFIFVFFYFFVCFFYVTKQINLIIIFRQIIGIRTLTLELELELIQQTPLFPVPLGLWTPNLVGW